jgi:hypothetical protein
MESEFPD